MLRKDPGPEQVLGILLAQCENVPSFSRAEIIKSESWNEHFSSEHSTNAGPSVPKHRVICHHALSDAGSQLP